MTAALAALVETTERALYEPALTGERQRADAIRPAMAALLASEDPIPIEARDPLDGQAVGNLLHADSEGRFHILAVVFPAGTSSGVHFHGCWGVIGYLAGGDEETRYRVDGDRPVEHSRHVWHQGDITYLLPEDHEGWHRVRNPGPGVGVSVHVLCHLPADHPHQFWDRDRNAAVPFPFVEAAPGRWRAMLSR